MSAECHLNLLKGETFRATISWLDASGRPVNLKDCALHAELRDQADDTLALQMSLSDTLSIVPLRGQINVLITAQQTAAMTLKRGAWFLKVTFPGGDVRYLAAGRVYLGDPDTGTYEDEASSVVLVNGDTVHIANDDTKIVINDSGNQGPPGPTAADLPVTNIEYDPGFPTRVIAFRRGTTNYVVQYPDQFTQLVIGGGVTRTIVSDSQGRLVSST